MAVDNYVVVGGSAGSGGGGVTSLNTLTGPLTVAAGTNISVVPSGGNTLTINSTYASTLQYISTATYTVLPADETDVSNYAGNSVFTLPKVSVVGQKIFQFSNQNSLGGTLTLDVFAGDAFNPSPTSIVMGPNDAIIIQGDGVDKWTLLSYIYGHGVVTSLTAGTGINVTPSFGDVTVTNTGVVTINTTGTGAVTIDSAGAGSGIDVNTTGGTISITTNLIAGAAIGISAVGGNALQIDNTGVTSAVPGTGISVSSATGAVTIANTGVVSLNTLVGALTLAAGTNISIVPSGGNTLTINSTYAAPTPFRTTSITPVTITSADGTVETTCSTSGVINLPQASTVAGLTVYLYNNNGALPNLNTINAHAGDTIGSLALASLTQTYGRVTALQSDGGTNWVVLNEDDSAVNLIFMGDSLTLGSYLNSNAPAASYPGQVAAMLGGIPYMNLGINGELTSGMISTELPQAISALRKGVPNILCLLGGVNDLGTGVSVGTVESNLTSIVTSWHSAGVTYGVETYVIILTMHPSAYVSYPSYPAYMANMQTVNTYIKAGSTGADAVADFGDDARLYTQSTTPWSSFPSTCYQSDNLHLKAAGYTIPAQSVTAQINKLCGNLTTLTPPFRKISTSTGVVLPTDFLVESTYTGGNTTLTLPLAASCPGQMLSFANYNSTANALLTVQGATNASSVQDTINSLVHSVDVSYLGTDMLMSDGISNWVLVSYSVVVQPGLGPSGSPTVANGMGVNIVGNGVYLSNQGVLSFLGQTGAITTLNLGTPTSTSASSYSVAASDVSIVTSFAGNSTLTLPSAASNIGRVVILSNQNTSSGQVTINTTGGDTVGGVASGVLKVSTACSEVYQATASGKWTILAYSVFLLNGTGISVTLSGNGYTIANTGVTSNAGGTGISVSASTGAVTITNTGVTSLSAGTGIGLSASTGSVNITNNGVTTFNGSSGAVTGLSTTSALKFRSGVIAMSGGTVNLAGSHGLSSITGAGWFLIGGAGNTEFLDGAYSGTAFQVWSSNGSSTSSIQWMAWGT